MKSFSLEAAKPPNLSLSLLFLFGQFNHLAFSLPLRKNKCVSKIKQPKMSMLPTPVYPDDLLEFCPNHVDKSARSACQNIGLLRHAM